MVVLVYREWEINWIQSKRRKTVVLQIHYQKGIIIRTPMTTTQTDVFNFLQQKSSWLEKKMNELQSKKIAVTNLQNSDTHIMYLGNRIHKVVQYHTNTRVKFILTIDSLIISVPVNCKKIDLQLIKWYKKQAKEYISERIEYYSKIMNVYPQNIWIKSYKSKWGLCRSDGTVSFNYKLMYFSPDIINYVVIHELAHLKEPNHSAKFYAIVKKILPNYLNAKQYLEQIGAFLI